MYFFKNKNDMQNVYKLSLKMSSLNFQYENLDQDVFIRN